MGGSMLTIYVKLWRIDGQKQTHIKGKSFKIEDIEDVWEPGWWVVNVVSKLLEKEEGGFQNGGE